MITPFIYYTGMSETSVDELRSILAQLDYTNHVCEWTRQGVPFCTHAYVPETDPITGDEFHEREDHGHLLKVLATYYIATFASFEVLYFILQRIAMCTREGRNCSINLEHYHEALKYPETRLTMSILRGDRKQSVRDAELMFNPNFLKWLFSKGYKAEAEYVEAVLGWHRANDERGLAEEERSTLNK